MRIYGQPVVASIGFRIALVVVKGVIVGFCRGGLGLFPETPFALRYGYVRRRIWFCFVEVTHPKKQLNRLSHCVCSINVDCSIYRSLQRKLAAFHRCEWLMFNASHQDCCAVDGY